MRKLVLAILMLISLSTLAQENDVKQNSINKDEKRQRLLSLAKINGTENIEAHLQSMIKANPNVNLDMEKNIVMQRFAGIPDVLKVSGLINIIEDPAFRMRSVLLALEIIAPLNNDMSLKFATKELKEARKFKGQTALSKPLNIDPKTIYDEYINIYSKLLFKAGKNDEAYKYTSEAYNNIKDKDKELIENYAFLSSLNGNYENSLPVLAKLVKEGKFEKRYVDQVRKGYQKLNPGKDVDAYIDFLKKDFIDTIRAQAIKLMVNEQAPNFSITDVTGKKVSLADFKGKTIVLDFWATWCGPCVSSFPAMQMAVNRYAKDPDVKFLFVHTWEQVADPLSDAKSFLSKRHYNFDLYMDTINPVTKVPPAYTLFNLKGIPTKIIIDGKGRMRFKIVSVGMKDEAAAEELVQMVEMARNDV